MGHRIVKFSVAIAVAVVMLGAFAPSMYITSDGNILDVFIIDGQSNAAYSNVDGSVDLNLVNAELKAPSHDLYYYGTVHRPAMNHDTDVNYGIHRIYDGSYKVGGLVAPFAYYLSELQGRDILVLDVGISAQSIANLVPGSSGGDWKMAIIADALNEVSGYEKINMLGWTWLQGESDTTMPVDDYIAYFKELQKYYSSIGAKECFIVKTRAQYGGNATLAQDYLIDHDPFVVLGTDVTETFTGTPYMLDNLHYSQAARIIISDKVAEVIPIDHFGDFDTANMYLAAIPTLIILSLILSAAILVKNRY